MSQALTLQTSEPRLPPRCGRGACLRGVGFCLLLLLALAGGCGREEAPAEGAADTAAGIERTVSRGPVTLTIRSDRASLSIAERLHLTLEGEWDAAYSVEFPRFGDKLEQFGIVDYTTVAPRLSPEGRVQAARTYVLEPFLSGHYEIPSMRFSFHRVADEEPGAHSLDSEPLSIEVTSLLPEEQAELDIEPIEPPVEIPARPVRWWWWLVGTLLGVLPAVAVVRHWRRRTRTGAQAPKQPAHEIAYSALRELVAEDLVAKGQIKVFYQRISAILRRYIEDRFALRAPEQTTEEFLAALGTGDDLVQGRRDLLQAFLTQCDLVKFAQHTPVREDIQETFDACCSFIEATRESEASGKQDKGGVA